jgi:hypothetical protein
MLKICQKKRNTGAYLNHRFLGIKNPTIWRDFVGQSSQSVVAATFWGRNGAVFKSEIRHTRIKIHCFIIIRTFKKQGIYREILVFMMIFRKDLNTAKRVTQI